MYKLIPIKPILPNKATEKQNRVKLATIQDISLITGKAGEYFSMSVEEGLGNTLTIVQLVNCADGTSN